MHKRPVLAIVVLTAVLSVSMAVPAASSAPRVRLYAGEQSNGDPIRFRISKTDAGRFLKEVDMGVTVTCEDATTEDWSMGIGWGGGGLRLTDDVFLDFDNLFWGEAMHLHGRIGQQRGRGTFNVNVAFLTPDEQAQLCTTGDLTWHVEYTRTLSRASSLSSSAVDGVMKVWVAPDGEVSWRARSFG